MSEPRILQLTLKQEFFAKIVGGKKKFEYREVKGHWKTRLEGREYDIVRFRNGYVPDVPEMDVEFCGCLIGPNPRTGEACYIIGLGRILSVKRWQS
jgi:hypothetical protein